MIGEFKIPSLRYMAGAKFQSWVKFEKIPKFGVFQRSDEICAHFMLL